MALITAFEVVVYSPAGREYPTKDICQLIGRVEAEFGFECLGEDLYDWLQDNKVSIPSTTREWEASCSYDDGDIVTRMGWPFESLEDLNTNDPTCDADPATWAEVKRFGTNTCANTFWEEYLRPIIANKVYSRSLTFVSLPTGPNGLTALEGGGRFQDQGFRTGSKAERSDYKKALNDDLDTMMRNMKRWVNKTIAEDSTCTVPLSTMPGCGPGLCAPASNSKRRWGFKH